MIQSYLKNRSRAFIKNLILSAIILITFLFTIGLLVSAARVWDEKIFHRTIPLKIRLDRLELRMNEIERDINIMRRDNLDRALEPTQTPKIEPDALSGTASVYSIKGCLGCNPERITASGQKLDDARATLALPCSFVGGRCLLPFKLGSLLRVTNIETGMATVALANDTGDFKKYGRVADLSLATAQAIDCIGLCKIKMEMI